MTTVLNTLAPVFLVIALGMILRRARLVSDEALKGMTWLVFWIALPALLFSSIAVADGKPAPGDAATRTFNPSQRSIFMIALAGMAACIVAGYLAAAALRVGRSSVGTFVQVIYRGNLAYIGLPVIEYAFASLAGEEAGRQARRDAVIALAPLITLYNVAAVVVLLAGRHRLDAGALRRMLRQIITNPLILSCVAGMIWTVAGLKLPAAAGSTLKVLGQIALPLALLSVGAAIATTRVAGQVLRTALATGLKVVFAPLLGFAVATLLGVGPRETFIAMLLLACPTAVAAYVMAQHMEGDADLAAQTVVVSTLSSIPAFAVIILLMGRAMP